MIPRLGVNIDHVATLRQQRDEGYPCVIEAARHSLKAGADQITIHLREDRRHIQDADVPNVFKVTQEFGKPLNLEMGCSDEIAEIAIATNPEWICLVPEKREEKTTEGGLDLLSDENYNRIKAMMEKLRAGINGVKISLFVEANDEVMKRSIELGADAVEIHTGHFATDFLAGKNTEDYLEQFRSSYEVVKNTSVGYHAGHGLTLESVIPLLELKIFKEYNIGHWIVAQSVFDGLGPVIEKFTKVFTDYEL
jgi:pyridoxine 5-phosphate synthase